MKSVSESYRRSSGCLYVNPHHKEPVVKKQLDKLWDNSNKSSRWGSSSQHTPGWGSTTSTLCLTASSSGWSTNEQSSSLVTNEDASAVTSVRSEYFHLFIDEGWGSDTLLSRNYLTAMHKEFRTVEMMKYAKNRNFLVEKIVTKDEEN